jgi:hypothetical protein
LVQTLSRIYAFLGYVIIKCPHIDNEVMDGFVTHVGRKMLDKDSIKQPQQREN